MSSEETGGILYCVFPTEAQGFFKIHDQQVDKPVGINRFSQRPGADRIFFFVAKVKNRADYVDSACLFGFSEERCKMVMKIRYKRCGRIPVDVCIKKTG